VIRTRRPSARPAGTWPSRPKPVTWCSPWDRNSSPDVYLRDLSTSTTTRITIAPGGGDSNHGGQSPVVSANGTIVAYWSDSDNLIEGDDNDLSDIFATRLRLRG
jgi:hypothetical protein